jgi:DNA-binding CsgD family transcriptional regulator
MQEQLTEREQELLNLLLEGVSPKEIAHKLDISVHTVAFHRNNLYRKLGINSLQELLAKTQLEIGENKRPPAEKQVTFTLPCNEPFIIMPLKDASSAPTVTQRIPMRTMNLRPYTDTDWTDGGKSIVEFSINQETINGVIIDGVLTINTTLARGCWEPSAEVQVKSKQVLQQLRRADGVRFKARGDGKNWRVLVHTTESAVMDWTSYEYTFNTIRNQIIFVNMPYSNLRQPVRTLEPYRFEFNRKNITDFIIGTVILSQELGSSSIRIWDFEIY